MGVTVCANGLSVVHQGSGGEANATLPDVCKTQCGPPVVPIPYGNNAKSADLADGTTTVTMDGGNSVAIKGSKFSQSTGDASGDKKGIVSGTIEDEAEFISASPTVSIEGAGVCRLSDQMTMNKANTMCMGGVQNPSVSVSEDAEGTYTLDLICRYPSGEPYANAPFELRDPSGSTIASGQFDASGLASVSGLAPAECILVVSESQDEYVPSKTLAENTPTNTFEDSQTFCTYVSGHRAPFWDISVGASSNWGILISPQLTDDDFVDIVYEQCRITAPYVVSRNQSRDFANAFISALNHSLDDLDTHSKYQPLLEQVFEKAHPNGDIVRIIYSADTSAPPAELLAELRYLGCGNTLNLLQNMDWEQVNNTLCSYINQLVSDVDVRLEYMQSQAQARGLTVVDNGIQAYRDGIKTLSNALPDIFSAIFDQVSQQVSSVVDMAEGAIINRSSASGFATNSGEFSTVVYAKSHNANRPPFVIFKDVFSH
ncbi:protein of unknown function [Vibrio xiamenensis]|uniref:Uncharacterized protein n=1 Tax=Vibrio xiamenensis TaxID=861298 RepID=A0A1G8DTU5_9VIBR|nr:DUF4150 domain-containing protein [Vibrio xiamenensis]SDH61011.1 protein of unknown function [Vibrio xiamenensis]